MGKVILHARPLKGYAEPIFAKQDKIMERVEVFCPKCDAFVTEVIDEEDGKEIISYFLCPECSTHLKVRYRVFDNYDDEDDDFYGNTFSHRKKKLKSNKREE